MPVRVVQLHARSIRNKTHGCTMHLPSPVYQFTELVLQAMLKVVRMTHDAARNYTEGYGILRRNLNRDCKSHLASLENVQI